MTTLGNVFMWFLVVVFTAFWFEVVTEWENDWKNLWGLYLLISPLTALMGVLSTAVVGLIIMASSFTDKVPGQSTGYEVPIYSAGVNTQLNIDGAFFLGCGTIHGTSTPSYRYFVADGDKYKLKEVSANNFDVVCTDTCSPKIVVDASKKRGEIKRFKWMWRKDCDLLESNIPLEDRTGIIYIPKNSIVQSFRIEL